MSPIRMHIPTTPRLHHLGLGVTKDIAHRLGFMKSSRNSYSSTTSWYPMIFWELEALISPAQHQAACLGSVRHWHWGWARKSRQDAEVLRFQSQSLLGPICLCSKTPSSLVAEHNLLSWQKPFNTIPNGDKQLQMENKWSHFWPMDSFHYHTSQTFTLLDSPSVERST